jgi:hypothetical protein
MLLPCCVMLCSCHAPPHGLLNDPHSRLHTVSTPHPLGQRRGGSGIGLQPSQGLLHGRRQLGSSETIHPEAWGLARGKAWSGC